MMTWSSLMFQDSASPLMTVLTSFHDYACMFLMAILILTLMNLFNSILFEEFTLEFSESDGLENVWTILPFVILAAICLPSLTLLYYLDTCAFCGISAFAVGHQWYWSYYFKTMENWSFSSYILPMDSEVLRLVDSDNRLSLPSKVPVRMMVTSSDVIHSWTIPSLGVKMDAIPGRLNQACFYPGKVGVYFGQCSEICGAYHSFMPIVAEVLPLKEFVKLS